MKYTIAENDVIFIIPGRNGVHINCIKGKLWLTQKADLQDHLLAKGDNMSPKNNGKIAIQAICDSCLVLEGKKFHLHELKTNNRTHTVNKIKIQQFKGL